MFCEESLGLEPFQNSSVREFCRLIESVDYFGTTEHFGGWKKKKNLY